MIKNLTQSEIVRQYDNLLSGSNWEILSEMVLMLRQLQQLHLF